ncbi:MAG: MarR family winged helix-turn-helix transcriptional regulator [Vicinamibacterales bacterium]
MTEQIPGGLFALLHVAGTAQAHVEARLAAVNLSLAKLGALRAIAEAGESLPLGQLAERMSCVKSNITQLVDRLEADGLVRREADPGDRRSRLAVLTDQGRASWEQGNRIRIEAERELFGTLTTDEGRQLAALMEKIEHGAA